MAAAKKPFGPGFLPVFSKLYKLEYAVLSIAIIAFLFFCNSAFGGIDIWLAAFFLIFPDFAFLPMLPFMKGGKWPKWGASLYNATHSLVPLAVAFAITFYFSLPAIPLLGWALHITLDRAIGFGLRGKE